MGRRGEKGRWKKERGGKREWLPNVPDTSHFCLLYLHLPLCISLYFPNSLFFPSIETWFTIEYSTQCWFSFALFVFLTVSYMCIMCCDNVHPHSPFLFPVYTCWPLPLSHKAPDLLSYLGDTDGLFRVVHGAVAILSTRAHRTLWVNLAQCKRKILRKSLTRAAP